MQRLFSTAALAIALTSCGNGTTKPQEQVSSPTFSLRSGTYITPQTVSISTETSGSTIYYTTDGTMPTVSSQKYSSPLTLNGSQFIEAIAVKNGFDNSPIVKATYLIGTGPALYPWNKSITYGSIVYQGQTYNTVKIGSQTWMAENLNVKIAPNGVDTIGQCYLDDTANCSIYGRNYTWSEVMNGSHSTDAIPSGVKGICPLGWHIPSNSEWRKLFSQVGVNVAGRGLKATIGWEIDSIRSNGTDSLGFRVLPAGVQYFGSWMARGDFSDFWTTSDSLLDFANTAWIAHFASNRVYGTISASDYSNKSASNLSLRCISD